MITFAEMADIDYVIGDEDRETPEERTELVNRAMKKINQSEEAKDEASIDEEKQDEDTSQKEELKGLMARRSIAQ
jgi:hypothetical protein